MSDVLVRILKEEHHRASLVQRSWLARTQYSCGVQLPDVTLNSSADRLRE